MNSTLLAFIVLLAAFLPAPAFSQSEDAEALDRAPVLLRGSRFFNPPIRNSGLMPEVRVRATVDTRGRIADVEFLALQPSTLYDQAFRDAIVAQLQTWRYAPALENGQAVETQIEWTVQFSGTIDSLQLTSGAFFKLPYQERNERLSEIGRASYEERQRMLDQMVKAAEPHLDPATRRRAESDRFFLSCDAEDPETIRIIGNNLETSFRILDQLFGVEPRPLFFKNQVYIFKTRAAFNKLPGGSLDPGFYQAPGFLAFHLEAPTGEELLSHILHVAVHAYIDMHLVRGGLTLPSWAEEGLADYISLSDIRDGALVPGKVIKNRLAMDHREGSIQLNEEAVAWDIRELKKSRRSGEGFSIAQILEAGNIAFSGANERLFYVTSWALIHFLRHGEDTWADDHFPRLMLYLAEGTPPEESLEGIYGRTLDELNERFDAYVKKL